MELKKKRGIKKTTPTNNGGYQREGFVLGDNGELGFKR